MARHYAITIYNHTFMFNTIVKAITNQFKILLPHKHINPINCSKRYEVHSFPVKHFILTAHNTKVNIFIYVAKRLFCSLFALQPLINIGTSCKQRGNELYNEERAASSHQRVSRFYFAEDNFPVVSALSVTSVS